MRFDCGKTFHFHLGLEVFESTRHIKEEEYEESLGVCFAFGFWHVDVEWPVKPKDPHDPA